MIVNTLQFDYQSPRVSPRESSVGKSDSTPVIETSHCENPNDNDQINYASSTSSDVDEKNNDVFEEISSSSSNSSVLYMNDEMLKNDDLSCDEQQNDDLSFDEKNNDLLNHDPQQPAEGTASLLGLFEPPTSTSNNRTHRPLLSLPSPKSSTTKFRNGYNSTDAFDQVHPFSNLNIDQNHNLHPLLRNKPSSTRVAFKVDPHNPKRKASETLPLLTYSRDSELFSSKRTIPEKDSSPSSSCFCFLFNRAACSTVVGSFTFALFHIVFCLAQASAIILPYSKRPFVGEMSRQAALSPIICGPLFIAILGRQIPGVYPTLDLFLVPFLAQQAAIVDELLYEQNQMNEMSPEEYDALFLNTFCVLSSIGMLLSGLLNILSYHVKLANLGAYLPYPVLGGFFSSIGIMVWTMAFSVDTHGERLGKVLHSGDLHRIKHCLIHHLPSLFIGSCMFIIGQKNRALMPFFLVCTVIISYSTMYFMGVSLDVARDDGWFWQKTDFVTKDHLSSFFSSEANYYAPPLPGGMLVQIYKGNVYYPAVIKGLPVTFAMAFLYLVRCSLHAPALKKNSIALLKWEADQKQKVLAKDISDRNLFQTVQDEDVDQVEGDDGDENKNINDLRLSDIMLIYGKCFLFASVVGSPSALPAIGVAVTLFKLGAKGETGAYLSFLLLIMFYLTNFEMVSYIPKLTFSSLLVVNSFDLLQSWFVASYKKIADKGEWIVVPGIVLASFVFGMLNAVFLGVSISTFYFVGVFFKTGIVKFIANGLTLHSTIERTTAHSEWLDKNGDMIQILVLQNYLCFGNSTSCLNYVSTMFEEPSQALVSNLKYPLPPAPKYLIIDLSLVTGMDTSAVDVFADIISLCKSNKCMVYITGPSRHIKSILSSGGVTPGKASQNNGLRFIVDMETALGKAEDGLIKFVFKAEEREIEHVRRRTNSEIPIFDGFIYALKQIDLQHGVDFAVKLRHLQPYTEAIELRAGESLFHNIDGTLREDRERGLFFIEHGMMKLVRDSSWKTNRGTTKRNDEKSLYATPRVDESNHSIGALDSRSASIGREVALLKMSGVSSRNIGTDNIARKVRLARIGPGWVVGMLEGCTQLENSGIHEAVTPCRLHHLPYRCIEELEEKNPKVALHLFKMMSRLSARRQEVTIKQLANLQSIMSSSTPTRPVDRVTMATLKQTIENMT